LGGEKRDVLKIVAFNLTYILLKDIISMRRKNIFTQNKKDWTTSLFKTIFEAVVAVESWILPIA